MTSRTLVTGESGEPFRTVVNNRASTPGAPLASKAIVPSLSDARCSGCWAATAIAHNAIKIIPVSSDDILNIDLLECIDLNPPSPSHPSRAARLGTPGLG